MAYYDVFNGDADGICALHQLRLADPVRATLVTGLKRDIDLLRRVPARQGDMVTVLDVSLDRNRASLEAILERGARVLYFDHHYAGAIPAHPHLHAVIDESGARCTSALVDRHLGGRFRAWAVAGAFGDGFDDLANSLAIALELDAASIEQMRELGTALNYNAYGETERDVTIPPASLYEVVSHYADPFELWRAEAVVRKLARGRADDICRAAAVRPVRSSASASVYVLPDAAWSRRVGGSFANRLALDEPHRGHAVLVPRSAGGYVVSVRAPRQQLPSAVEFCHRFPTGGGRRAAAGIDHLESARLDEFIAAFMAAYRHPALQKAYP